MKNYTDDPYTNRLLSSSKAKKRVEGIERLYYRGPLSALIMLTSDRSKAVREEAVLAIGSLDEIGIRPLVVLLGSSDETKSIAAANALFDLSIDFEETVVKELVIALDNQDFNTREYAAWALSIISPSGYIPVNKLIGLLDDEHEPVVTNSLLALVNYGKTIADSFDDKGAKIVSLLEREDEDLVIAALNLLGSMGSKAGSSKPKIEELALDRDSTIGMAAEKALLAIKKDGSRAVRGARKAAREIQRYINTNGTDEYSIRKTSRIIQQESGINKNINLCTKALAQLQKMIEQDLSRMDELSKIVIIIEDAVKSFSN